jgi:hypothetical protein
MQHQMSLPSWITIGEFGRPVVIWSSNMKCVFLVGIWKWMNLAVKGLIPVGIWKWMNLAVKGLIPNVCRCFITQIYTTENTASIQRI